MPHASGSCRVSVNNGSQVLVGVKVQVQSMDLTQSLEEEQGLDQGDQADEEILQRDLGKIVCRVDWYLFNISQTISPPSASKSLDYKQIQTLVSEYSEFLNRILNGPQGGLDLKSLCIVPGSLHWVITVDILILEYGGNVLDTLFAAVRGALYNTRIPKVSVESSEGHFEFDVAEEETEILQGRERIPVCVTFNTIGNRFIVDASPIEEWCSDAGLSLCFNPNGHICAIKKRGNGGIEPSLMNAILQTGKPFAQEILKDMTQALQREELRIDSAITTSRPVILPR